MHCISCEVLLNENLKEIEGLKNAKISHKTGTAEIEFTNKANDREVENAIKKSGYELLSNKGSRG